MDARRLHGVRAIRGSDDAVVAEVDHDVLGELAEALPVLDARGRVIELTGDHRIHDAETARVELLLRTEHHGVTDADAAGSDRSRSRRRAERPSGDECDDGR